MIFLWRQIHRSGCIAQVLNHQRQDKRWQVALKLDAERVETQPRISQSQMFFSFFLPPSERSRVILF